MASIRITICTDGAAFHEINVEHEVGSILHRLADQSWDRRLEPRELKDTNGDPCGTVEVIE